MDKSAIDNLFQKAIADFSTDAALTPELFVQRQKRIKQIQDKVLASPGVQHAEEFNDGRLSHHFAEGLYGRELIIPKDTILVGKVHLQSSFNVLAKGAMMIICPHNGVSILTAPHTFASRPFTKRVGIALEDSVWITCHGTDQTTVEGCEETLFTNDFSEDLCQLSSAD